ncbi:GFRA3 protein, partial [Acromyrmex insinuator]
MFGCICPNNHMKRRCDKIFSTVNHNPCVEVLPSSTSVDLSGTDSALYPFDPQQENYQEIWLPPTSMYPYFLFPGTARTPPYYDPDSTYDIREPGDRYQHHHRHGDRHHHQEAPELPGRPAVLVVEAYDPRTDSDRYETDMNRFEDRAATSRPGHDRASGTVHLQPQSEHDAHPHQHRHHHQQHQHHRQHLALPAPPSVVATLSSSSAGSYAPAAARPTPTTSRWGPTGPAMPNCRGCRRRGSLRLGPPTSTARSSTAPTTTSMTSKSGQPRRPSIGSSISAKSSSIKVRTGPTGTHKRSRDFVITEGRVQGHVRCLEKFLVCVMKVIAHPDNSTSFEVIESQLENPLIDAKHRDLFNMKQIPIPVGHHHRTHHKRNQTDDFEQAGMEPPSSTSDIDKIQQPVKLILSSTCHHAYTSCKNDPECKNLLEPVLNHCDSTTCARNECMEALQHFYKTANHKHSVEIAFCLCRKTDNKKDECIVAQEKMHPTCAQRIDGAEMPTCHSLAETCKENRSCRLRLEYYEQSCAVDSMTKKCAGPTSECRKAMLGILGTELHTNCACKGTELNQLYGCLGWQRLLWVNPCVVESQKDYHARRKHHHSRTTTAKTTTAVVATTTRSPASTTATTAVEQVEDNQIPEVTRWPTTEPTETWEITTTTISTTPSTTTTTTPTPRFCVVQRSNTHSQQYIREGKGKRLYREDEPECSELCVCAEGEQLVCNTLCVETLPCKTDFAFYNHEAPAYQAHRGPCLCYSGGFICMRPSPDTYSIPHGVFMFLGYSEKDETLLKQYNNVTVLDAVSSLDNFMRKEVNNQTVCTLFLYNATRENVIAVARLGTDNPPLNSSQAQSLQHLLRVKEECASMMQDLSDKINNKHHEVRTHPLLSIFKMAEVEVKMPYSNEAAISRSSSVLLVVLFAISFFGSTCLFDS